MVIHVVKAGFPPNLTENASPANAGVARLCGVSPHPIPDTATALPNHPRYQLRYTRIFTFLPLYHGEGRKAKLFLAAVIYVL